MHFPRLVNMLELKKKFAKTYDMCQSNLLKQISKTLGQKHLERVGKSGKRHVQIQGFPLGN
jgi:hypothetical protein